MCVGDSWVAPLCMVLGWIGELALLFPNFKETSALLWYLGGRGQAGLGGH